MASITAVLGSGAEAVCERGLVKPPSCVVAGSMVSGFLRQRGEVLKIVPDRQATGRQIPELPVNPQASCSEDPARWCVNAPCDLLASTQTGQAADRNA
jgi:hypothetical protein